MNEFERSLLAMVSEQNEVLKRIERASVETARETAAIRVALLDQSKNPNIVRLTSRVRSVEGEVSELTGRLAAHDAELERIAAGSNGR